MKQQSGFTLIELIMVIVILGILAATALPKFVNLKDDAQKAAIQGVAGALASAGSINYGSRLLNKGYQVASNASCDTIATNIMDPKPTGYTFTAGASATASTITCSVDADPAVSAVTVTIPVTN